MIDAEGGLAGMFAFWQNAPGEWLRTELGYLPKLTWVEPEKDEDEKYVHFVAPFNSESDAVKFKLRWCDLC